MINHKKLFTTLLLFMCLVVVPLTASAQSIPGWDIGPGWTFPSFYITASSDSGCSITPSGISVVVSGSYITYNYSASTGFAISQVLIDGVVSTVSSPFGTYTFVAVNANHTISISSSPIPTVTPVSPSPTPLPTPAGATPTPQVNPHNHPTKTLSLYFRSDTYNYSSLVGYGLDKDFTNNNVQIPISVAESGATITYGFRIYVAASDSVYQELTSGQPDGLITISGNQSTQTRSSGWNCPDTTVVLGAQVLKIDVYAKVNDGDWTVQASYISPVLMTKELMPASWTFSLNLAMSTNDTSTTCYYRFGDSTYRSTVTGVVIVDPNYTDIQTWQWMQGDIIGLILGSYLHIIGPVFYLLIYVMIFGGLYFRHRTVSPVAFIVVLLGGAGGLSVWVLLEPLYAAVFSVFIILAIGALIFKVIR